MRAFATSAAVAVLALPAAADAHGGISVAEGGGKGVRIAVQGSEAGPSNVDFATTLAGPGTGDGSRVVYWIRPAGRERAVRVATERDEGGVHHAEIPTEGRGSWQDWDVSAYVTLNTGGRLRVTNDERDPPGPLQRSDDAEDDAAPPGTRAAPITDAAAPSDAAADSVQDVSGESDGAPGWVVPSLVALIVLGAVAGALGRRRTRAENVD
ncbi:MAG: hypothetical protein M0P31_15875 [Solirubrobacteraceae bacterium]|nr:hypothetical protein [Solirubrobacteraceae bacterium]